MINKKIHNFAIMAHIDHGKSTLADRFLEITNTVSKDKMKDQYLDSMDIERERGITIKMRPCRMDYKGEIVNLIDTPGHVDFSYEVSRALAAVEGAVLLIDASKGVQAQTLANLELAKNLIIIPVLNKIDLAEAQVQESLVQVSKLLNTKDILQISAKKGINIEKVLDAVLQEVPEPTIDLEKPFKALIFDSVYDSFKGVIAYIRVFQGKIKVNDKIFLAASKTETKIKELGYFNPDFFPQTELKAGEIGYIATGIKEPGKVKIGDTILNNSEEKPLAGYKEPEPMVFANIYPQDPNEFTALKEALQKLKLNDPSLVFDLQNNEALGRGFRCGFLGTLHIEIVSQRLEREFGLELVISTPSVVYKIIDKKEKERLVYSPTEYPDQYLRAEEPWAELKIIVPSVYLGKINEVLQSVEGRYIQTDYLGDKVIIIFETPLREIIKDFYEKIKGTTQGYASLHYRVMGFKPGKLIKMEILIAGKLETAFSRIIPENKMFEEGKKVVKKLKEILPSQQFAVALQAIVGGRIIARETISSRRKDVTAPLYGGDYSRKRKLLERQKKGKKELKEKGKIKIPPDVYFKVFKA
ncbi:MAG: translation elongation factor 4 [Candidatus Pacebacteria bacterium]|nr:translation elongation factor 4 [Candidatus Paceibacterota bacterium]